MGTSEKKKRVEVHAVGEGSEAGNEPALDFDVEPAVPGTERAPSRRLFIKLTGAFAGLSYVAPKLAHAGGGAGLSPVAVQLPFQQAMTATGLKGGVSNDSDAVYDFDLGGDLSIDQAGEATISAFSILGSFVSGEDLGPIAIVQRGNALGTYAGTRLRVSIPINYSDGATEDAPGVVDFQATLTAASGQVEATLVVDTIADIGVQGFIPPEP